MILLNVNINFNWICKGWMIENIKQRKFLSLNDNINLRKTLHQQKHLWLKDFFHQQFWLKDYIFITNFSVIISTSNIKKFCRCCKNWKGLKKGLKRASNGPHWGSSLKGLTIMEYTMMTHHSISFLQNCRVEL